MVCRSYKYIIIYNSHIYYFILLVHSEDILWEFYMRSKTLQEVLQGSSGCILCPDTIQLIFIILGFNLDPDITSNIHFR